MVEMCKQGVKSLFSFHRRKKSYDYLAPAMNPADIPGSDLPDDVALYLSFPGNPCHVIQKHILESLAFGKGPMMVVSPHFTEPALHGQLKGLGKARLKQVTKEMEVILCLKKRE